VIIFPSLLEHDFCKRQYGDDIYVFICIIERYYKDKLHVFELIIEMKWSGARRLTLCVFGFQF
jgi:hypothetical protein